MRANDASENRPRQSKRAANEPASERQRRDSGSPPPLHFARFQTRGAATVWVQGCVTATPAGSAICWTHRVPLGSIAREDRRVIARNWCPKTKSVTIVSSLPPSSEISCSAVKNHAWEGFSFTMAPHSHSRSWRSENGWAPHSHLIPIGPLLPSSLVGVIDVLAITFGHKDGFSGTGPVLSSLSLSVRPFFSLSLPPSFRA